MTYFLRFFPDSLLRLGNTCLAVVLLGPVAVFLFLMISPVFAGEKESNEKQLIESKERMETLKREILESFPVEAEAQEDEQLENEFNSLSAAFYRKEDDRLKNQLQFQQELNENWEEFQTSFAETMIAEKSKPSRTKLGFSKKSRLIPVKPSKLNFKWVPWIENKWGLGSASIELRQVK